MNIISFYGGQKGDTLANWLNKEYTSSGYCANHSLAMHIKNTIAVNTAAVYDAVRIAPVRVGGMIRDTFRNDSRVAARILEEENELLAAGDELFVPFHLNGANFNKFLNKNKFNVYHISTEREYLPEVAFNFLIKRKMLNVSVESDTKERVNALFQECLFSVTFSESKRIPAEYKIISYEKLFKEVDSSYFEQVFNRPVDDHFRVMNEQTTLPDIVSTPSGPVRLNGNKLEWV